MWSNKPQQQVLGRNSILLAFDKTRTTQKTKKYMGCTDRQQVGLINLLRDIEVDYTDRHIESLSH
jgi:hypothetical protein